MLSVLHRLVKTEVNMLRRIREQISENIGIGTVERICFIFFYKGISFDLTKRKMIYEVCLHRYFFS